ncbi:MAG: HNH endonuclease [Gemmatimonadales bacterium]
MPKLPLAAQAAHYRHHGAALLPDSIVTPGAVLTTDTAKICHPGYAKSVRHVSGRTKHQAYILYGATKAPSICCEVDHLISLELGGSNDLANLWPEPYQPTPGSYEKDKLENWLHAEVCAGKIPIEEAQREIAGDWFAVYERMGGSTDGRMVE